MNIRKTFLALGAMILGVGFFGASPASASHYTPHTPCIAWGVASTQWPTATTGDTHFFICDGSYQNQMNPSPISISGVRNAGQNQSAVVKTKLLNAGYDLFVFKSPADYNAYTGKNVPAGAGSLTTTNMSADHPGPAIAIFEEFCTNPPTGCTSQNYLDTARLVNHEVGHAVDNIMGMPSLLQGPGKFVTQFDLDRQQFNTLTNVNWTGLPGTGNVPGNCNIGQNFDKLKCWLNVTYSDTNPQFYREFWAHCYAASQTSGGYPPQPHTILKNYFKTGGMAPSSTVRSCTIVNNTAQTP